MHSDIIFFTPCVNRLAQVAGRRSMEGSNKCASDRLWAGLSITYHRGGGVLRQLKTPH